MEKLKKCHFNCGDTDLDKHSCQCYSDWLQANQEIPKWIIEYDAKGYQSSAGKAIRILIEIIKAKV